MKRIVLSVALVLGLGITQTFAQEEQASNSESLKNQNVVGKIFDDLKESTRAVHEINKAGFAAEKDAFRARHEQAVEPNPDFVKFREAKGLKGKMAVVGESIRESCREVSEKEKERRERIRTHESYRMLMEEQRVRREATISRG